MSFVLRVAQLIGKRSCIWVTLASLAVAGASGLLRAAPIDDFPGSPYISPTPGIEMVEISAARSSYGRERFEECRGHLKIARAKAPNLPPVDLMLARLHFANSRPAAGKQLLEEVAVAESSHPEVYLVVLLVDRRRERFAMWSIAVSPRFTYGLDITSSDVNPPLTGTRNCSPAGPRLLSETRL